MLLEIYKDMLYQVQNKKHKSYVTIVYEINLEESEAFWTIRKDGESVILQSEWISPTQGRYEKIFYGHRFAIQFTKPK